MSEVLAALARDQERLGAASEDAEATDPRAVLEGVRGYLGNNRDRMTCPEYRRRGLPVASSWVELRIKEVNHRVKGTETFWNGDGAEAEAVLPVRAVVLSHDQRLTKQLAARTGSAFHRRVA